MCDHHTVNRIQTTESLTWECSFCGTRFVIEGGQGGHEDQVSAQYLDAYAYAAADIVARVVQSVIRPQEAQEEATGVGGDYSNRPGCAGGGTAHLYVLGTQACIKCGYEPLYHDEPTPSASRL